MHVISFLGKSGRDRDEKPVKSSYENTTPLPLKEGKFHNSLEVVLSSFPDATHYFLATKDAYGFQENLLKEIDSPHLLKFSKSQWLVLKDEDLDAPMQEVLNLLKKLKNDEKKIVLDVTHGFRHQPILGSFATLLGQVVYGKKVHLLFAKGAGNYTYILLDSYLDLGMLSWVLSSFSQTLTVPKLTIKTPLVDALSLFCEQLHANVLSSLLEEAFPQAVEALNMARNNPAYTSLAALFDDVEKLLERFEHVKKSHKSNYSRYGVIAKIMHDKSYLLIAFTYLHESARWYLEAVFKANDLLLDNEINHYDLTTAIYNFIRNKVFDKKLFKDKARQYVEHYRKNITKIVALMEEIRKVRNEIAHINNSYKFETIDGKFNKLHDQLHALCVDEDILDAEGVHAAHWPLACVSSKEEIVRRVRAYLSKTHGVDNLPKDPEILYEQLHAAYYGDFKTINILASRREELAAQVKETPKTQELLVLFSPSFFKMDWQSIQSLLDD